MGQLKEAIESSTITTAPVVYDGISARVVERVGFDAMMAGGAAMTNSRMGKPDYGFIDLAENEGQSKFIVEATSLPVIVDCDTGFGNALNVYETVRRMEKIGAAGVMIEDQQAPKRCGHMAGKSVISKAQMCQKVRAAVDAKQSDDFIILARTDADATMGTDEAISRLNAYADHGADLLFADALETEESISRVASETNGPVMVNMGYGIRERPTTPLLSAAEMEDMGVNLALYGRIVTGAAVNGMQAALEALVDSFGDEEQPRYPDLTVSWEEYTDLLGLPAVQEQERRYAGDE